MKGKNYIKNPLKPNSKNRNMAILKDDLQFDLLIHFTLIFSLKIAKYYKDNVMNNK